jgi:hypothetical protein
MVFTMGLVRVLMVVLSSAPNQAQFSPSVYTPATAIHTKAYRVREPHRWQLKIQVDIRSLRHRSLVCERNAVLACNCKWIVAESDHRARPSAPAPASRRAIIRARAREKLPARPEMAGKRGSRAPKFGLTKHSWPCDRMQERRAAARRASE